MRSLRWLPALGLLALPRLLAGCNSTPSGPPEELAPRIVTALDAGEDEEAAELFDAASAGDEERLYPLLYQAARGRYERGDGAGASRVLRFMAPRYPKARAIREAEVYALFLERAQAESATPELVAELEALVGEVRKAGEPPLWIALVEAQLAIDRDEESRALESLASFQAGWDGRPEELAVYVDDLERYMSTHFQEDEP
jgi:thioredoxin-like negative regulator of GroEL